MKKWYLVDDATSTACVYDEIELKATSKEEAIREARMQWDHLTYSEKRKRDAFYVAYGEETENGLLYYNTTTDFYSFLSEI
jgi:hypothetical protein